MFSNKERGRKGSYRTIRKQGSYATQNLVWALSDARLREFVFGPLWLCIFGVFRLWVQQSGQGKRLSRCMWIFKGMTSKEAKGPSSAFLSSVSFSGSCGKLSLLPLCRVRAEAPGPLLLGSGILEPHLHSPVVTNISCHYY